MKLVNPDTETVRRGTSVANRHTLGLDHECNVQQIISLDAFHLRR